MRFRRATISAIVSRHTPFALALVLMSVLGFACGSSEDAEVGTVTDRAGASDEAGAAAGASGRDGSAAGGPSLATILERWNAHLAEHGELDAEQRDVEVKTFLRSVPWGDITRLCCEGQGEVAADSLSILAMMAGYRFDAARPTVEQIAELIESHGCMPGCKWQALDWELTVRDSLAVRDRERLALAMLRGGGDVSASVQMRRRLLTGAAAASAADTVMSVMMSGARGDDDVTATLGLRMLRVSIDPAAPDSLAALLREYRAADSSRLDAAVEQCHDACARLAGDLLVEHFRATLAADGNRQSQANTDRAAASQARRRQRSALHAMARSQREAAAQAMLDYYADGGVIVDSTFARAVEDRQPYYDLWLATRIAEPWLNAWLREGSRSRAELALELYDRMLRFGPPIDGEALPAAIDVWIERAPADRRERARAVRARAVDPPPVPGSRR